MYCRNGPPYPIEHTILKKGTYLNSISSRYHDSEEYRTNGKWMYTYRDDEEWDNKIYKGPFSKFLVLNRGAIFIKEHRYVTIKDLKMPTKKERIDEFKKINRKQVEKDVEVVRQLLIKQNKGNIKERENYKKFNVKKMKSEEDYAIGYEIFSYAMEESWYYKSTREYMKRMSKKYEAMVDDNNQGIYNNAHDPIIIFNAKESLKTIESDPIKSYIQWDDVIKNTKEVKGELTKIGRKVKL